MKAFNYFKIDCIRCRYQLIMAFVIVVVFCFICNSAQQGIGFSCGYGFFLAVIFAGQPFNQEAKSESGFINMLPGTRRQREIGRFLYALLGVVFAVVVACAVLVSVAIRGMEIPESTGAILIAMTGAALFLVSIQMVIMYSAGKGKSQQLMTIIQVVPSLLLFFIIMMIGTYVEEHNGFNYAWILENKAWLSSLVLAIGVLALGMAFIVANRIVERRDYA